MSERLARKIPCCLSIFWPIAIVAYALMAILLTISVDSVKYLNEQALASYSPPFSLPDKAL